MAEELLQVTDYFFSSKPVSIVGIFSLSSLLHLILPLFQVGLQVDPLLLGANIISVRHGSQKLFRFAIVNFKSYAKIIFTTLLASLSGNMFLKHKI
jgi:hypothetical protein